VKNVITTALGRIFCNPASITISLSYLNTIMGLPQDKQVEERVERVDTTGSIHSLDSVNNKGINEDILAGQQLAAEWVNGSSAERKLVRKLDWRILPCCWILYLLGFLDRANIG
jgi:hypothetical protein